MSADPRYTLFAARAVFDGRLTAMDVRVLAALGTFTDRQGWCHPSQTTIANRIGTSRTRVTAAIKSLVSAGYVQTVRQERENGSQSVNLYRVLIDLVAPEALDEVAHGAKILEILPVSPADITLSAGETPRDIVAIASEKAQDMPPPVSGGDTPLSAGETPPCQPVRHRTNPIRNDKKNMARGARLCVDWKPRSEEIEFGKAGGLTEAEVDAAADHMRDWAASTASSKALKRDWNLTFRNWLRTTISDANRGRRPVVTKRVDYAEALRIWASSDQTYWNRDKFGPAPNEDGYRGPKAGAA